jgi:endopeptidase La
MSGISIRDYKINNLQKDYNWHSELLYNTQRHITRLLEENIINVNDKNHYFKTLNELLRQMNNKYNNHMVEICEADAISDSEGQPPTENALLISEVFPLIELSNNVTSENIYDELEYLISICRMTGVDTIEKSNNYSFLFVQPFDEINKEFKKIGEKTGFSTVSEILESCMGKHCEKIYGHQDQEKINLYSKIFVPTGFFTINNINNQDGPNIVLKKVSSDSDTLIDNVAELSIIKINRPNEKIIINGYINNDSLNIVVRTSQICNNMIYHAKKNIEAKINERKDINEKFKKNCIKNAGFLELIGFTEDEYIKYIEEDYKKYRKLIGCSFMSLMKEFIKDSIKNMYNIIRLLLYGSEENINIAGLLFGLTKDKKIGNDMVANIIYRNLSYISQAKLRKTSVNIKNELDKIKALTVDDVDIKKQIALCKNMPPDVKKACVEKAEEMKASNNEYYKQQLYVKTLLNFPWISDDDDTFFEDIGKNRDKARDFLDGLMDKLNQKVYGHKDGKNEIKELVGKWFKNPKSAGSSIGLYGPPGVGKTLLAKAIGDALGIPFVQITLGGQNDGEILHGHGYTYSSAQPGLVVKRMVEAGSARCIMYFDELDKTCKKHDRDEIQDILIHMTDPNMNGEFQDRFFHEVKFPLNKVIFIFSYNNPDAVDSVLLDRMEKIEVKPYSVADKIAIGKNFLMKELLENIGYDDDSVIIKDDQLENLINNYVHEAGVRDLKRKLQKILLKMNIDHIYKKEPFQNLDKLTAEKPVDIDLTLIERYLDKPSIDIETIHDKNMVGVVNGLYATTIGKGGIIPIQIYCNKASSEENFMVRLTGSQGKVMKESVITAMTTAMEHLDPNIVSKFVIENPHGFHVHTPSGATPKDGPSAGAAFVTAFVSRILNLPINHEIAMTGENDLQGRVTKIGGLVYKLTGAKKAGVKTVLVSSKNAEDIDKIKQEHGGIIDDDFKVILVNDIVDVLKHAIVGFDEKYINPVYLKCH